MFHSTSTRRNIEQSEGNCVGKVYFICLLIYHFVSFRPLFVENKSEIWVWYVMEWIVLCCVMLCCVAYYIL
jgi:hypothetical protein